MASHSQIRWLGQFLYTQNPFYLISCFLILYGLQIATIANGDLFSKSLFLTLSIAAYTLLMSVTCIGVVRLGQVWEDARSILLVVIISQIALSTGLDELSITDWSTAVPLIGLSAGFAVAITELTMRSCRLRLPSWYRLSFYSMGLVFFMMPIVLGHAVGDRNITLTNWGAPLFSMLIAAGLLLLIPAIRRGDSLVADNGTPWSWPLYPLSAFAIVVVLAGIRSHAIWMSFGFMGAPVTFEPFLLLPIALAILILIVESDSRDQATQRSYIAMATAPALLLGGISRGGLTHLPIQADLQAYFGSALTIALVMLVGFYLYLLRRRVSGSEYAVVATLLVLCGFGDLPEVAEAAGLRHWMFAAVASLFTLVMCLWQRTSDRKWLAFATVSVITILMAGNAYDHMKLASIAAAIFAAISMLAIGACFHTQLAIFLRQLAAAVLIASAGGIVLWHVSESPGWISLLSLAGLSLVSIVYMQIVRRLGWLYVFTIQTACLLGIMGWDSHLTGSLNQGNWPIRSGLICFVIGLTITSAKTGIHRRLRPYLPNRPCRGHYQSGL